MSKNNGSSCIRYLAVKLPQVYVQHSPISRGTNSGSGLHGDLGGRCGQIARKVLNVHPLGARAEFGPCEQNNDCDARVQ